MATASSLSLTTRNSLLRWIALSGMFIFLSQFIHQWITVTLVQQYLRQNEVEENRLLS